MKKKYLLLICMLLAVGVFSAYVAMKFPKENVSEDFEDNEDENELDIVAGKDLAEDVLKPHGSDFPDMFETEEELIRAATSNTKDAAAIKGLNEFYRTKSVPEHYSLDYITLKDTYVTLHYTSMDTEKKTEESEVYYLISWYRTMEAGNLKKTVENIFSPDSIRMYKEYYIVTGELLQDVFWEQDGQVFVAVTPSNITDEEMERFCNAEKVAINK